MEESVKLRRDSTMDDKKGTVKMKLQRSRSSIALSILSFMVSSYSQEASEGLRYFFSSRFRRKRCGRVATNFSSLRST